MDQESLSIREKPGRGFYVEGLHDYVVNTYAEAKQLINVGLDNRAMAPTAMNITSSRSHTVLTVHLEQKMGPQPKKRGKGGELASGYIRTLRSKFVFVDLAGSERVGR